MNKRLIKGYFLIFLILVLYITATVPFPKNTVFWIAFGFCAPVFLAQILTLHTICRQDILIKDRALEFPRLRINVCYMAVQFGVSLLLMKFSTQIPIYAAVFMEVAILLIAVVGFYAVESACAEVIRQHVSRQDNSFAMQSFQEQLNRLILHCENEQIQNNLRKLANEIRFCSPISTECTLDIEGEIAALLTETENASLSQDADSVIALCDKMAGLLKERDRICKCRR